MPIADVIETKMSCGLRTNYMDGVSVLGGRNTNQEIIWLDVTVNEGLVVNSLNACNLKFLRSNIRRIESGRGSSIEAPTGRRRVTCI